MVIINSLPNKNTLLKYARYRYINKCALLCILLGLSYTLQAKKREPFTCDFPRSSSHKVYNWANTDGEKYYADKKYRLSLNGVYAYRYGINTEYLLNSILKDLGNQSKHCFGFTADAHMALNKSRRIYVGFYYSRMQSNASVENTTFIAKPNLATYSGTAYLQTNINVLGISGMLAVARKKDKHCFYFTFGLNSIQYYEDFRVGDYYATAKQNAMGTTLGFKYDKRLNRNWALNMGLAIDRGIITNILTIENGIPGSYSYNEANAINLARLSCSVGLSCYLGRKKNEKKIL
ncbi:MAG: hypothetical protein V4538_13950 [Bacteroidota bacterium]